jgi:hypothetical protein
MYIGGGLLLLIVVIILLVWVFKIEPFRPARSR